MISSRYGILLLVWSLLLTIGLQSRSTYAFTASNFHRQQGIVTTATATTKGFFGKIRTATKTINFSTPSEDEESSPEVSSDPFADPLQKMSSSSSSEETTTSYPINLPSPILLGSSMILAIIGTGCGFDIFSDAPRFPVLINAGIAAGGLSLCTGLFYASILKAQAETEEDDKKYMSGR